MPEHLTVYTIASHPGDPRCYVRALLPEGYEEHGWYAGLDRVAQAKAWARREYPGAIELTEGEFGRVMMRRLEVLV